jgi:hypothetical protein
VHIIDPKNPPLKKKTIALQMCSPKKSTSHSETVLSIGTQNTARIHVSSIRKVKEHSFTRFGIIAQLIRRHTGTRNVVSTTSKIEILSIPKSNTDTPTRNCTGSNLAAAVSKRHQINKDTRKEITLNKSASALMYCIFQLGTQTTKLAPINGKHNNTEKRLINGKKRKERIHTKLFFYMSSRFSIRDRSHE